MWGCVYSYQPHRRSLPHDQAVATQWTKTTTSCYTTGEHATTRAYHTRVPYALPHLTDYFSQCLSTAAAAASSDLASFFPALLLCCTCLHLRLSGTFLNMFCSKARHAVARGRMVNSMAVRNVVQYDKVLRYIQRAAHHPIIRLLTLVSSANEIAPQPRECVRTQYKTLALR
jgi:hypothetical protein